MSQDCRNDCLEPLMFPKWPRNRPGLPHIEYRIGTYSDFREVLLRNLNKSALLSSWTHREPDDPGIALLEGVSILGDILTFYQELYANEVYLRTAQWRESVSDLVRLIGYRLSPGLGGKATFAFEVKGDKPVTIPKGFSIQAQVKGLEQSVEFEAVTESIAYSWLSKFNLYRPLHTPDIMQDTKEFYIFSPDQYLKPIEIGDRLIIGDPYPLANPTRLINGEIVIVDAIRELHGHKLYKIKGSLKRSESAYEVVGFKLGRSFKHFGHNSPQKFIKVTNGIAEEQNQLCSRLLSEETFSIESPTMDISGMMGVRKVDPKLEELDFPLESEVDNLSPGNMFLFQGKLYSGDTGVNNLAESKEFILPRSIENVRAISMTWGSISGATTLVTLNEGLTIDEDTTRYNIIDIREIQFHEALSPLLQFKAGMEETSQQKGTELHFYGTDFQAQNLKNRMLEFIKPGNDPFIANVTSVQTLFPDISTFPPLHSITLDQDVNYADFPNENPTITVYGNLIEASQGKTEQEEILGNGNSQLIFQTFKIPKAPLTYLNSPGESPPEVPELQIYVNKHLWKRVPSFFGRGSKEEIFIVREDEKGDSWVQFGDGKTGARLPSGIGNVMVVYRTGTGAYGALKEGTSTQAGGKLDRLDKIQLLGMASGGSKPETGEKAREAAPRKIQSLDRLVSLKDIEGETLSISGISKVRAIWDIMNNIPTVVLTIIMETGRDAEFSEIQGVINNYNRCRGPQRFPIEVQQGKVLYVYIDAVIGLHPSFREDVVNKAIKEALGMSGEEGNGIDGSRGLFGFSQRQFRQNEYISRIKGVIQNVEGVVWADVTAFGSFLESNDPLTLCLPAEPKPLNLVVACDSLHILSLYKNHLQLNVSKVESKEVC